MLGPGFTLSGVESLKAESLLHVHLTATTITPVMKTVFVGPVFCLIRLEGKFMSCYNLLNHFGIIETSA